MLLQFHVLISIYASILLAELLYPEQRQQRWLGKKGFIAACIGLLLWLPVGYLLTDYLPATIFLVLAGIVIITLLVLTRYLPVRNISTASGTTAKPWWFFWLGLLTVSLTFMAVSITPEWQNPPPMFATFGFVIAVNVVSLFLLIRWSRTGTGWDDRHRLALLSGLLGFFLVFNVLSDLEVFEGKVLVTLISIWGLLRLRKTIHGRCAEEQETL